MCVYVCVCVSVCGMVCGMWGVAHSHTLFPYEFVYFLAFCVTKQLRLNIRNHRLL